MTPQEVRRLVYQNLANAGNFVKADLHVHSDDSHDFPQQTSFAEHLFPVTEKDNQQPVPAQDFLGAARTKGLGLIAVTDHMKCRKACEIARLSDGRPLALPGIEVSVKLSPASQEEIHLLCIFREGTSSEDIEHIFDGIPDVLPYEQRAAGYAISTEIRDFVDRVHGRSGVCIASHANTEAGIRTFFFESDVDYMLVRRRIEELEQLRRVRPLSTCEEESIETLRAKAQELGGRIQQRYLQCLIHSGVDAVQVQKSTDYRHYSGEHTKALNIRPIAAILSTDAHCLDAIGYEKKVTFIKMAAPSWDNLKAAIEDPQTRIRYADNVEAGRFTKIKGLVFLGEEAFFKPLTDDGTRPAVIGCSDNLTAFIGGRGAGKSAVIDALRYAFKDEPEIRALPVRLRTDIEARLAHTLRNTTLYVLLQADDGEEVVVKSFFEGWEGRKYESFFMSGEEAGIDLSKSSKYHVEIYGWSEIETLGTDTAKQLELIDKFIPEMAEVQSRVQEKRRELERNLDEVYATAKALADLIPKVKDFAEVQKAYERINTPDMQAHFARLDLATEKQARLNELKATLQTLQTELGPLRGIRDRFEATRQRLLSGLPAAAERWALELWERLAGQNDQNLARASEGVQSIIASLQTAQSVLDEEDDRIGLELGQIREGMSASAPALDVRALSAIEKRDAYKKKYDRLLEEKGRINTVRGEVRELLTARNALLGAFYAVMEERSNRRQQVRDKVNQALAENIKGQSKVDVEFYRLKDRSEFERTLGGGDRQGVLKHVGVRYIERRFAEILGAHLTPREFAARIMEKSNTALSFKHPDGNDEISPDDGARIFDLLDPRLHEYDEDYYDADKLRTLLDVQQIALDDIPEIRLDGQPITGLSPGQRCSALVPIILLQGTSPVVIDQPEDNLDNKLVFELVVDIVRNLKEFRQIVVATHNPNIPVSGDAEQIVVFESVDKNTGRIVRQGSIDDPEIISHVKTVMEGGDEAFRLRAKKYRFELRQA
jgi:DNA repair ATPase RecN